jgi:hypothetical protein
MPRPLRIECSGAIYHVMNQGDRKPNLINQTELSGYYSSQAGDDDLHSNQSPQKGRHTAFPSRDSRLGWLSISARGRED